MSSSRVHNVLSYIYYVLALVSDTAGIEAPALTALFGRPVDVRKGLV